jgi:hypothetical protein
MPKKAVRRNPVRIETVSRYARPIQSAISQKYHCAAVSSSSYRQYKGVPQTHDPSDGFGAYRTASFSYRGKKRYDTSVSVKRSKFQGLLSNRIGPYSKGFTCGPEAVTAGARGARYRISLISAVTSRGHQARRSNQVFRPTPKTRRERWCYYRFALSIEGVLPAAECTCGCPDLFPTIRCFFWVDDVDDRG